MDKTPLTLTLWAEDVNNDDLGFQNPVAKEITEKTGITLNIRNATGSITNAVDVMLATGKYPDLMFSKYDEAIRLMSGGAFVNLAPMLDRYGQNIQKVYGPYLNRNCYLDAGTIYILGDAGVDDRPVEPTYGFELQNRVVMEQNYPKIETLADYEAAIKNSLALHPTTNGHKTIGMLLCTDDWRWSISLGNMAYIATGLPDDGNYFINPETLEAELHWLRPQEKEYYRWLNRLYSEGVISGDSFTQSYAQYLSTIATGAVLGLTDTVWEYQQADLELRAQGKYDLCYGIYPAQLNGTTKMNQFRDIGYGGGTIGIGISVSCRDKARALRFIDWLSSDEGQILRQWGVEGVNYTVDSSGKRVISQQEWKSRTSDPSYKKNTGIGVYVTYAPVYGQGVKDPTGNYYNPVTRDTEVLGLSDVDKKVLSNYCSYESDKPAEIWGDLFPGPEDCSKTYWGYGSTISPPSDAPSIQLGGVLKPIIKKDLCNVVICPASQFEQYYQKLQDDLRENGAAEIGADFTKYVKKAVELYGSK